MKKRSAILALMLALTGQASATDNPPVRWFEVEVILFTHDTKEEQLKEEFVQKVKPIRYRRTRDLLTRYHFPDISRTARPNYICDIEDLIVEQPRTFGLELEPLEDPDMLQLSTDELSMQPEIQEQPEPLPSIEQIIAPLDDPFNKGRFADFVTDRPDCLTSPWLDIPMVDEDYLEYHYDMFPRVIIAGEKDLNPYVHLISPANFKLREVYRSFRQTADIRPILHTAWRQPAGAESTSRATRLYAGIDYSRDFDFQGNPIVEQDPLAEPVTTELETPVTTAQNPSVVDGIEKLLAMVDKGARIDYSKATIQTVQSTDISAQPKEVREVDGLFRIYIDPFNYLHIDAEFNVRKEVPAPLQAQDNSVAAILNKINQPDNDAGLVIEDGSQKTILRNYHFKQTRRVITKQVHYFDHPFMGMIVQIRRYGW